MYHQALAVFASIFYKICSGFRRFGGYSRIFHQLVFYRALLALAFNIAAPVVVYSEESNAETTYYWVHVANTSVYSHRMACFDEFGEGCTQPCRGEWSTSISELMDRCADMAYTVSDFVQNNISSFAEPIGWEYWAGQYRVNFRYTWTRSNGESGESLTLLSGIIGFLSRTCAPGETFYPNYQNGGWRMSPYCGAPVPDCACEENFNEAANKCESRTVTWNGAVNRDSSTGAILEISDVNNQGLRCGRITLEDGCPAESGLPGLSRVGNPIECDSGRKVQLEVDFQANGSALSHVRSYRNTPDFRETPLRHMAYTQPIPEDVQILRIGYPHQLMDQGSLWGQGFPSLQTLNNGITVFNSGRGRSITFLNGQPASAHKGSLTSDGSGTIYRTASGIDYHFDVNGRLLQRVAQNGQAQTYTYPSGDKVEITDHFGRQLVLHYTEVNGRREVARLTDPAGNEYHYDYDGEGSLVTVTYPEEGSGSLPQKHYLYETGSQGEILLTGILDENGHRVSTWSYDDAGRATLSERANGFDRVVINYQDESSDNTLKRSVHRYRTENDYEITEYEFGVFNGGLKPLRIARVPCPGCPGAETLYSYDESGYLQEIVDPEGVITRFKYDLRGLLQERIDAHGTPEARTITTEYHPSLSKPVKITEPGRITTMTYDAQGRLTSRTTQSTTAH